MFRNSFEFWFRIDYKKKTNKITDDGVRWRVHVIARLLILVEDYQQLLPDAEEYDVVSGRAGPEEAQFSFKISTRFL